MTYRYADQPCQACYPHPWHKGPCRYCDCNKATVLTLVAVVPTHIHRDWWTCVPVLDGQKNAEGELEVMPRGHFRTIRLRDITVKAAVRESGALFVVVNDQRTKWWGFSRGADAIRHMRDEKSAYRGEGAKIRIVGCSTS